MSDSLRKRLLQVIDTVDRTLPSGMTFILLLFGGMALFGAAGSLVNKTQLGMLAGAFTPFAALLIVDLLDPDGDLDG